MPAAPSELNPEAKEVDRIVLRCLMKKKEGRYQNAEELQRDLEKFIKPNKKQEEVQEKLQLRTALKDKPNEERERIPGGREESKVPRKEEKTSYEKYIAIILAIIFVAAAGYNIFGRFSGTLTDTKPTPTPSATPFRTPVVSITHTAILPNNFTNSFGMEFMLIPAGEFDMGSPQNEAGRDDDEGPLHLVKIANAFYMGKYEITQKQWRDVMGTDPSYFKGDNLPVEQVSWNEVQEFISRLNEKEGRDKYRLPSEAEWEYAARAGTTTRYYIGDDASKLSDYEWYEGNETHEVGQKKPNPWGLYDIHGNVWEWMQDKYHSSYDGAPTDGSAWEGDGSHRVIRGGSFDYAAEHLRSANRNDRDPGYRYRNTGLRIVMES